MKKESAIKPALPNLETKTTNSNSVSRKKFLSTIGLGALGVSYLASCQKDTFNPNPDNMGGDGVTLDFKDDFGVLNYAYALEQLEAAFYIKVAAALPAAFNDSQKAYFRDVQYHEIAHREFFKKALGAKAIADLEVDFSSIDFTSKDSVLGAAKAFEDLGVAAYNGAGKRITTDAYLVVAGQIVSVEARHAAYIRDQISNGSFADSTTVDAMGLDKAMTPDLVLPIAQKYVKTKINAINL